MKGLTTNRALEAIALFKLTKGVLLVLIATGAWKLIHVDIYELAFDWATILHVDPDGTIAQRVIEKLLSIDPHTLKKLSVGLFVYAALFFVEGGGLLRGKKWAEYLTVVATASLIPFEIYELAKRVTAPRLGGVAINVFMVVYLVRLLRAQTHQERPKAEQAAS